MNKIKILMTGLSCIICLFSGCQNYKDVNKLNVNQVQKQVNDTFELKFFGCPSCGYLWILDSIDSTKIKLINKTYRSTNPNPYIVGGYVIETWIFAGLQKGNYNLSFIYKRPWLTDIEKTESVRVIIN